MKKLFLTALLAVFTLSIYSCRETNERTDDTTIEADMEETGDDIEDGFEETGEEIEAGANEVGEEIEAGANEVEAEVEGTDDNM